MEPNRPRFCNGFLDEMKRLGVWSPSPNQPPFTHIRPDTAPQVFGLSRPIVPLNPTLNPSPETYQRQTLDLEAALSRLSVSDRLQNPSDGGFNGGIARGTAAKSPVNGYGPGLYPRILWPVSNQESFPYFPNLNVSNPNPNGLVFNYGSNSYGLMNGCPEMSVNHLNNNMCNGNGYLFPESGNGSRLESFNRTIMTLACSQSGCQLLEQYIPSFTNEELTTVFWGLMNHVPDLMVDSVGKSLFQKLVELCSEEQRTHIVSMLARNVLQFIAICSNSTGYRRFLILV